MRLPRGPRRRLLALLRSAVWILFSIARSALRPLVVWLVWSRRLTVAPELPAASPIRREAELLCGVPTPPIIPSSHPTPKGRGRAKGQSLQAPTEDKENSGP